MRLFLIVVLTCPLHPLLAQEANEADGARAKSAPAAKEVKQRELKPDAPWLRLCKQRIDGHQIALAKDRKETLKRLDEPVLYHTQSVRGDQIGAVFLWIDKEKRPVAICDSVVAPEEEADGKHYFQQEFLCLCEDPIFATLNKGRRNWITRESSVDWKQIPLMDATPKTQALMVIQAKRRLGDFEAYGIDWRNEDQRRNLRLLPKPIYQYSLERESAEKVVGAVFAFCLAVDPEIIVTVEARTKDGVTNWYQSFASFSDMSLAVKREGKVIWDDSRSNWNVSHIALMERYIALPAE